MCGKGLTWKKDLDQALLFIDERPRACVAAFVAQKCQFIGKTNGYI
jgi:hypothetical protein